MHLALCVFNITYYAQIESTCFGIESKLEGKITSILFGRRMKEYVLSIV